MATNAYLVLVLVLGATFFSNSFAADPDITSDFVVPSGTTPSPSFFTFSGLRSVLKGTPPTSPLTVTKVSQAEFPALVGQSVSYAFLQYAPNGINAPHTHPRSTELLLVVQGWLEVGFVDTNNKLFSQTLQTGDVFVFPKGLVHFELNRDYKNPAMAIAAFGSSNPGAVPLPKTLFASGIEKGVLAISFKTDAETIEKLVSAATMG